MATYAYEAIDASGKSKKSSLAADSQEEAAKKIKDQGMTLISIQEQGVLQKDLEIPFLKKRKVPVRDLSVFCRQFSSLSRAGVSIINALEMLSEQTENKKLRTALLNTLSWVEKGETLSNAMKLSGDAYPPLLLSMVAAGEASGSLEKSIDRMGDQFEKSAKLQGLVKKAMMYPIILGLVAIAVVVVLMVFVIPNFTSMFDQMGSDLPFMTKLVQDFSNTLIKYWYIYILVIVGIVVAYKMFVRTDGGRHKVDALILKIPVIGELVTKSACASFTRTLSTLLQAGMPVIEAIEIAADTMTNIHFKDALYNARTGVSLGLTLSSQLKAAKRFPPMVVHMTNIGEETGSLETMLTNIANYYDEEVETTTQSATALMEPAIIVVLAGIVCVIIAAVYGPMLQMYNMLG
ncbi:MAG: type II secretion system F family protein [Lachnospira sp.]|nr:type II secretion system F family protein [Lachnospira sp.]